MNTNPADAKGEGMEPVPDISDLMDTLHREVWHAAQIPIYDFERQRVAGDRTNKAKQAIRDYVGNTRPSPSQGVVSDEMVDEAMNAYQLIDSGKEACETFYTYRRRLMRVSLTAALKHLPQ